MRAWLVLAILLLPVVQGEPTEVLADDSGDLTLVAAVATQPIPSERYPHLDILSVDVQEQAETIDFRLHVVDLNSPQEGYLLDDSVYYIIFDHHDQSYALQMNRIHADQYYTWGSLYKATDGESNFNFVRGLQVEADLDEDVLSASLLREDLLDLNGAAPFPGRSISNFFAVAHLRTNEGNINIVGLQPFGQYDAWDIAPNDGQPTGEIPILLGLKQSGHAELFSSTPMRASNGEATTFVYSITARNTGDKQDLFELKAQSTPSSWDVVIPDNLLILGPGESLDIPVLVTTPFTHQHGAVLKFLVEMQSTTDPASTGRAELGIRYHEVPQPAGHHNKLWLHSQRWGEENQLFVVTDNLFAGNGGAFYVNTMEQDEQDQQVPVKGQFWGWGFQNGLPGDTTPKSLWRWDVFLNPGLEMGLDFDLESRGSLSIPITSQTPLVGVSVEGQIVHLSFDEAQGRWHRTVLAKLAPTPSSEMTPNQETVFDFEIIPSPEADRLEFSRRAAMVIELNMTSDRPAFFTGVEAPEMLPGGTLELPLFEYRDQVDEVFASAGQVMFHAIGPQNKMVNPGEAVILATSLKNHAGEAITFDLDLSGVNSHWAEVLAPDTMTLADGESYEVVVVVRVPATALDGDVADLVMSAQAKDEPSMRTLVRLVAEVDDDADHADEARTAQSLRPLSTESTPGVGPLLFLALLGVAMRRLNA